jgi:hypothetical protein
VKSADDSAVFGKKAMKKLQTFVVNVMTPMAVDYPDIGTLDA